MALFNAKTREIEAKLVYYGTAAGGKTTNLIVLHRLASPDQKQKLVSLNTAGERTLFFDLLPFDLGNVLDWRVRLKLYTLPGQAEYNETRRIVLAGADGIVFVADSAPARAEENVRSVNFFKLNCRQNGIDPETIPLVFQYNKRDVPAALPSAALEGDLNWRRAPYFLSVAFAGTGVLETFEEAVTGTVAGLLRRFGARRPLATDDQIRAAVHDKLGPLATRHAQWDSGTRVGPGSTEGHVVVTREVNAPAAAECAPSLDTRDLLEAAVDNEMRLLNELMAGTPDDGARSATPPRPSLDAGKLAAVLAQAGLSHDLERSAQTFLGFACELAGAGSGSVLLVTPGASPLREVALLNLARDPLNALPASGGAPLVRRLPGLGPLFGADLLAAAYGTPLPRGAILTATGSVPIGALGRVVGVFLFYADTPVPTEARPALDVLGAILSLVLSQRALERRLERLEAAEQDPWRALRCRNPSRFMPPSGLAETCLAYLTTSHPWRMT